MARMLGLTGPIVMLVTLVGCESDPREGLISDTKAQLEAAAAKVSKIKGKVDEAVKKATETNKPPDFKETAEEAAGLKQIAAQMKDLKMKADGLKDKTTDEQRRKLTETYKDPINNAIDRLSKARKELNDKMVEVEKDHKDALKDVRAKLVEAEAEFELIARQR
jgi:flagellar hook-basal body complex protein FliE